MRLAFAVLLLLNLFSTLIPFQPVNAADYFVRADPNSTKTINNPPALATENVAGTRGASVLSKLPIDFIENRGQWDGSVKFVARKGSAVASFESSAIKLGFGEAASSFLTLAFEGASPGVEVVGETKRKGYYNFFFGDDAKKWGQHAATYASLLYRGLYDGIDMRVREEPGKLEYDLILAPAADLSKVSVRADGASQIEIASDGSLILRTARGQLRQTPPVTWEQSPTGEKRPVECRFRKIDSRHYGFETIGRDPRMQLIIDPGLEWGTFLGGGGHDTVEDIALARDGSGVTITGSYGGVSRTATLTVMPQAPPTNNTVAIQRAEYSGGRLRVEATSSSSNATLTVFVTSTNAQIGVLRNEGGGRYRGDFNWPSNLQNITVRSSLGGSATRAVSAN